MEFVCTKSECNANGHYTIHKFVNEKKKCKGKRFALNVAPEESFEYDELINCDNIGSYIPRFEKADIVAGSSKMMKKRVRTLKNW